MLRFRRLAAAPALAACACLLTACASHPQIQPLPVKPVQPGQSIAPDPALALVSGRLAISEDGKSKVPYDIGTDAGCVAGVTAAMIVLLPLAILAGGVPNLGSPDCESKPPALALLHLESRKAGPLSVGADGRFSAQLVPGTYLVPEVWDNGPIAATMVFQVPSPGRAYYLGDVALDHSRGKVLSLDIRDDEAGGPGIQAAHSPSAPARALLARFTPFPGTANFRGSDADQKWNAYLDGVVAELDRRGIRLLTAAPPSLAPANRAAVAASFERRRLEIQQKWDAIIKEKRRRHCTSYGAAPPCHVVGAAEEERDAELKALDEEQRLVVGSD